MFKKINKIMGVVVLLGMMVAGGWKCDSSADDVSEPFPEDKDLEFKVGDVKLTEKPAREDHIEQIEVINNSIKFKGGILAPNPCHSVDAWHEIKEKEISIFVDAYRNTNGGCVAAESPFSFAGTILNIPAGDYALKFFFSKNRIGETLVKEKQIIIKAEGQQSAHALSQTGNNSTGALPFEYKKGEILIKFKKEAQQRIKKSKEGEIELTDLPEIDAKNRKHKVHKVERVLQEDVEDKELDDKIGLSRWQIFTIPDDEDIREVIKDYRNDPNIEGVQPSGGFNTSAQG